MVALDWSYLSTVDEAKVAPCEDVDLCEKVVDALRGGNLSDDDVSDPAKVQKIFRLAQFGLKFKQLSLDLYEKAFEEEIEHETAALRKDIAALQQENREKTSLISDLQNGGTGRDARYLRDELRTAQAECERLQRENRETNNELSSQKYKAERMTAELMENKANNRVLEERSDQLRQDLLDLQKQMEAQREALLIRREGQDEKDQRRQVDREKVVYMQEVQELQEANEYLKDQVEDLAAKLKEASEAIVKVTNDFGSVQTVLEESDKTNTKLSAECAGLKLQVQDLHNQVISQSSADDKVMQHVNSEVNKWRDNMAEAEQRHAEEQRKCQVLEQQLSAMRMGDDKRVLAELGQVIADKDKQIEDLQSELGQGAQQMKLMGEFCEGLQSRESDTQTSHLERLLNEHKAAAKADRERLRRVESESADRDKQLAEAITKIGQYESGTYGLHEAVQEIKDLKKQLEIRDKDISNMTASLNKLERNICQALDENEEMRRRLGIDPNDSIDLSELRFTKAAQQEQAKAVNRLLAKEVERLEQERLQLKKMLRKQAMHRGVRAVELGLKTEDLEAIEEAAYDIGLSVSQTEVMQDQMLEKLRESRKEDQVMSQEMRQQVATVKNENNKLSREVETASHNMEVTKAQLLKERDEREKIERALKEAIKEKPSAKLEEQPELARLLALLESRAEQSSPDLTHHLRAQVSQLSGRNLELRTELSKARDEVRRSDRERASAVAELARLSPEGLGPGLPYLSHHASAGPLQGPVARQLIVALQEVEEKEKVMREMEHQLKTSQDHISRITAQQAMLYEEHCKLKSEHQPATEVVVNNVQSVELKRVQDVLAQSGNERERSIAEQSRKIVLLKVNERTLTREMRSLQERDARNQREITRLRGVQDNGAKELRERLMWLERFRDTATHHIQTLQAELLASVPEAEVQRLYTSHTTLSTKYRKLLEEESSAQTSSERSNGLQNELSVANKEIGSVKRELLLEKQKSAKLESLMDPNRDVSRDTDDKISNLELQLLNEKQRADHSAHKHAKLLCLSEELERRNAQLEGKFTELTERNLGLQAREGALSAELQSATSTSNLISDKRTKILERQVIELQGELKRVQSVADIATHQSQSLLLRRNQRDSELDEMRATLLEIEKQSDDKLTIGLLTQRLVECQRKESDAERHSQQQTHHLAQEQARILQLEHKLSDQLEVRELRDKRVRSHVQLLSKTICHLRIQFSGAVPLPRQQRLADAVRGLLKSKREADEKVRKLEDAQQLEQAELTTSDGPKDRTALRLSEMRLRREVKHLDQRASYLEQVISDHERTIRELEEENAGVYELLTEQRIIADLPEIMETSYQPRLSKPARIETSLSEGTGAERVVEKIVYVNAPTDDTGQRRANVEVDYLTKECGEKDKLVARLREELSVLKSSIGSLQNKNSELKNMLDKREEELVILRCANPDEAEEYQRTQASAQRAISVLNDRIEQKECLIAKYQGLLKELRDEARAAADKHQKDLDRVQKEHDFKEQEWLGKFQELSSELSGLQEIGSAPNPNRRAELEELILEQDKGNALLRNNIFKLREEISNLKTDKIIQQKALEKDHEKAKTECEKKLKKSNSEMKDIHKKNLQILEEVKHLTEQLDAMKGSPTKSKQHHAALKAELAERDAENNKLKQALGALKQEMTGLIEDKLKDNANTSNNDIEALIKKQSDAKVEGLKEKMKRLAEERDAAITEAKALEAQLASKTSPKQDKEIERLTKQLANQKEKMSKLRQPDHSSLLMKPISTEKAQLERKIAALKQELEAMKGENGPENKARPGTAPAAGTDKWLENKKTQKKLETLRKQLEAKSKEVETVSKQNLSLRDTVESYTFMTRALLHTLDEFVKRLDKEKTLLQTKLRNTVRAASQPVNTMNYTDTEIFTQELKRKIFELEEEKEGLRVRYESEVKGPAKEQQEKEAVLKQTISALEQQLCEVTEQQLGPQALQEFNTLRQANVDLEMKLIEKEHDALSMKLRAEHCELELPRLRSRVKELQQYAEVLKPVQRPAPGKPTKGKSVVELERVVNAMKRVIENLQKENGQQKSQISALKKSAVSPAASEEGLQSSLVQLRKDLQSGQEEAAQRNREIEILRQELDSAGETRAEMKEKIERLGAEYKLQLEMNKSEHARILENQLEEERGSLVAHKERIAILEEDSSRKSTLLAEVKRRLTGVAEKELDLEKEIALLHQCQMPNGAKEVAKEAVKIKRENAKLSADLRQMTQNMSKLDPVFFEQLEDIKYENDRMVKKIVFYQKQLKDLAVKYPGEEIELECPMAVP